MENTKELFRELENRTSDLVYAKDLLSIFISFLDNECPFGEQKNENWRCKNFAILADTYKSALCVAFYQIRDVNAAIEEIVSKGLKGEVA